MSRQTTLVPDKVDYNYIVRKYPWIVKKKSKIILSPDSDGFLCGLLYSNFLDCEIVGYYDGKILILKDGLKCADCVFLDTDIFRSKIKSIGHHMVLYNKNNIPANWNNFSNCIQLNNLRNFDLVHDFERKYPFGTIHFVLGVLQSQKIIKALSATSIWPLLFSDGVWNNLFGYTENCLDWIDYLDISNPTHILNPIFCGNNTVFSVMKGINNFLRIRDTFNATGYYMNGRFIQRESSRTGDKLRISNPHGIPINLVRNGNLFDIHTTEVNRISGFINALANHMGWNYFASKWTWNNFKLYKFFKSDLSSQKMRLNARNYNLILNQNPISLAITSGQNMEFTIEKPDNLP